MKIFGFVPARMASSRFPGKPLKKILNKTMLEHVYDKAEKFNNWFDLKVATCDQEIKEKCIEKKYPFIMTSKKHKRCLDRVYEAAKKNSPKIKEEDLVVCVQGDEPMLNPKMIHNVIAPFKKNKEIKATVLAMEIVDKRQFVNPDTVKIIHDLKGKVLYTSRSPIPFCENFSKKVKARRIYGIFAFKWSFLKKFNSLKPSFLETIESCDSNRICDNGGGMYIAKQKYEDSFSVDSPSDIKKVEKYMLKKSKF